MLRKMGAIDCNVCCDCWCHIGSDVNTDREDKEFLQENLIDKNGLEIILVMVLPLHAEFLAQVSVFWV